MLVPSTAPEAAPTRILIGVAVGEPGKEDVAFAGRLARHFRAEVTILTVLPETDRGSRDNLGEGSPSPAESMAERFLLGNSRTLWRLGVPVSTVIRYGNAREQILAQLTEGQHDLLVLGAPLPGRDGVLRLGGLVGRLLPELKSCPVLIIRSPEAAS
ncbi:MAG TPA: universal stress protein [Thermoanaerobaculia bacterium]|nr:universal stress protein [Thermoanaerobaculia bacterium]